jgi:hypothetical protein
MMDSQPEDPAERFSLTGCRCILLNRNLFVAKLKIAFDGYA